MGTGARETVGHRVMRMEMEMEMESEMAMEAEVEIQVEMEIRIEVEVEMEAWGSRVWAWLENSSLARGFDALRV